MPRSCSRLSSSLATALLPLAGSPVSQTAKAAISGLAVRVRPSRVEALGVEHVEDEAQDSVAQRRGERRIPERIRHDQPAKSVEGRHHREDLAITGALQIALPEAAEQPLEGALEAPGALQREEKEVEREAGDVVGRLAPFAARAVENREVDALAKQNVPRMEVAVHLAEPPGLAPQAPAPLEAAALDVLQGLLGHRSLPRVA